MLDKSKSFCKKYIASQLYTKEFLLTASNIIVIKKLCLVRTKEFRRNLDNF